MFIAPLTRYAANRDRIGVRRHRLRRLANPARRRSVEGVLAAAVGAVADEQLIVHGAGRTDAGVHANQQVAHFDTTARRTDRQWCLGVNSNLPPDVAIRWVHEVPRDFDARRSALRRRYRYSILQQATRPALARARVWWIREPRPTPS